MMVCLTLTKRGNPSRLARKVQYADLSGHRDRVSADVRIPLEYFGGEEPPEEILILVSDRQITNLFHSAS